MKNLALLLVLVVSFSLASCGKKETSQLCKECGEAQVDERYNGYCESCFETAKKKARGERFANANPAPGQGKAPEPTAEQKAAAKFQAERLQIGMEVPDIEGEDVDGVKFKLSDYRGKVVVLDFWGDW